MGWLRSEMPPPALGLLEDVVPQGWSSQLSMSTFQIRMGFWHPTTLTDADTIPILPRGQRSRRVAVIIDRPIVPDQDRRGRPERYRAVRARRSAQ
jgi:hypothetical protein